MKTEILTARIDQATGELGYSLAHTLEIDYPMVATEGALIAHDIIEHVNGIEKIGTIADELQAVAGVWRTRGQFADIRCDNVGRMHSPQDNVLSDVLGMGRAVHEGSASLIMREYDVEQAHEDPDYGDLLEYLTPRMIQEYIESETSEACGIEWCKEYYETTLYHFAKGWAAHVEQHPEAFKANNHYWGMAQALDPWMTPEYEGQQIQLHYDLSESKFYVDEYFEFDDYEEE